MVIDMLRRQIWIWNLIHASLNLKWVASETFPLLFTCWALPDIFEMERKSEYFNQCFTSFWTSLIQNRHYLYGYGSISGCRSGSFKQNKIRKTSISTVLCLLYDFLSFPSKSKRQTNLERKLFFDWYLESHWRTVAKCHGSTTLILILLWIQIFHIGLDTRILNHVLLIRIRELN